MLAPHLQAVVQGEACHCLTSMSPQMLGTNACPVDCICKQLQKMAGHLTGRSWTGG